MPIKTSAQHARQDNTPPSQKSPKKIALALQGGGTHGAFTWGVLDAFLEDERFEIEGLSGTSAGGLNAVALIQGHMQDGREGARRELRRLWTAVGDMAQLSPFKNMPFQDFLGNYNLDNTPGYTFMGLLETLFSPYEFNPLNINFFKAFVENFFDCEALRSYQKIKLFLCATQVSSGKLKIFSTQDLSQEVILASACLPYFFQAIEIEGEHYWDGGFVGNPAIYPLIYDCDTPDMVIVQLSAMRREALPRTAHEIRDRHKEITYNACLMREMRSIEFITQLLDKGFLDPQKVKKLFIHLIRDEELFSRLNISSALNGNTSFLEFLFAQGRQSAQAWIKAHYADVGHKTTTNIHQDFVSN
jgi:NTE family protein